ncbi:hypothetical protein GCM10011371_23390 [Novosphingobium marinum]|uniref:Uncharacterized protein n=1 Tax=Novosphingobium marinum TaxID=1514948 RepID=A0A7Z0BUN5_9SPHN|nr:hypothetical protein [Novosphingobium marinum]NYH96454.1 hypothetical protein [Novosphingobium marinum]GGC35374.1 hypothetical protein GCM10011371_23390 [Novosphingobium marinum]
MTVAGTYACSTKTPMGEQNFTLAVTPAPDGNSFTGQVSGDLGSMDVAGTIDGDRLSWKMELTKPMPVSLDCEATVAGDTLSGEVGAGLFGTFPVTGTRTA